MWLLPPTLWFDRIEHRRVDNIVALELRNSIAAEVDGQMVLVPSSLQVRVEPEGYGIAMQLVGVPSINFEFPPAHFELEVPTGTVQLPISDLGREGGLFRR